MTVNMSSQELQLCKFLRNLPLRHKFRYGEAAGRELLSSLFWSLAGGSDEYIRMLFPNGPRFGSQKDEDYRLRDAQGAVDGAEYTEAARGKACGHIFKAGEATYRCKTCSADDTCVLCSKCHDSSDHTGHMVYVSTSPGNSGCCDCGDPEAWRIPVHCLIHSEEGPGSQRSGKARAADPIPEELIESIRMTIGRAFDYICDVISCSPEQLRLPKTVDSIKLDEKQSRLSSSYYHGDLVGEPTEYAVLLWNDEKHTVEDVRDHVARACKREIEFGLKCAHETDDIGRSIIKYGTDVEALLGVARIVEQIKLTVTIRSSRDTFREQMCGTMIQWLGDIAGCSVGGDHNILRQIVCEEMLAPWRTGSEASNAIVGKSGIDDHEVDERNQFRRHVLQRQAEVFRATAATAEAASEDEEEFEVEENGLDDGFDDGDDFEDEDDELTIDIDMLEGIITETDTEGDVEMTEDDTALETQEATIAGYPQPPPPPPAPPAPRRPTRHRDLTPSDSDTAEPLIPPNVYAKANMEIPKTPGKNTVTHTTFQKPARYWMETPEAFTHRDSIPPHEDLWARVRLDWMILFDLRMWKKVRIDLRDLYISTVVTIPEFKRVLGLRFAGLYTTLAQLYLIADREPDHSIINISLQMLTTPSITSEIVERGNFLTNLMAILYTFLTTRQVGHPHEIFPNATLAFDAGSVTNRRMYHFFLDLKYLFGSEHVQEQLRKEDRYIMQFLDLVKLHQGICPNTRAVGDHVEYETDLWISASLITREINRLCRLFSEAFKWQNEEDNSSIFRAIRMTGKAVILNSIGTERKRFSTAEIKDEMRFKKVDDYEFDTTYDGTHRIVKFVVEEQPISFHHALHYTLSWLIECGKSMEREQLVQLLSFTTEDLLQKPKAMGSRTMPSQEYSSEDRLMAAFDYPLRVCAWLAQMRASMWVRNGMSLRHQAGTYRGVTQRDVSHHRDIFLLQTAMIVCQPSRVLVTMIDRFGMEMWMKGLYEQKSNVIDDAQLLDVAEDLIHLLIVLLSDRTSLTATKDEQESHVLAMRRDITHVLCFKPLSFSDICSRLPDKFQEQEECQDILDEMTIFKAPEGLSDTGTFELKDQFLEDIDPYIAHYTKNQREESENAYRKRMSKKTGKPADEIVFEPKLRPIEFGVFKDLAAFTREGIFAQIIYYALSYPLKSQEIAASVPVTRVETFLQVVLHLILLAIAEDKTDEDEMSDDAPQSFVYIALTKTARINAVQNSPGSNNIVSVLEILSTKDDLKACHPKIGLVLKRMRQRRPKAFDLAFARLGVPVNRVDTASPAIDPSIDLEKRKKTAQERQARVMAQFQQQQKNFIDNQGDMDWGSDDLSGDEGTEEQEERLNYRKYPSGTCILCQEETNDSRPYGTFAMITESQILRQTNFSDPDFIREATHTPVNLDRTAEAIRPFGISGENRQQVHKIAPGGNEIVVERQGIGRGYPAGHTRRGPVTTGCGHIMHYQCFDTYFQASRRRHTHQIARHHPEKLELNEFVCPLCKALGNTFLPIIWRAKEETYPGILQSQLSYDDWLLNSVGPQLAEVRDSARTELRGTPNQPKFQDFFKQTSQDHMVQPLAGKLSQLIIDAWAYVKPATMLTTRSILPSPLAAFPPELQSDVASSSSSSRSSDGAAMIDVVAIYRRLRDTIIKNKLDSNARYKYSPEQAQSDDLCHTDVIAQSLAYSIAAVEIQQRGVASTAGATLLDAVPQQSLTHLRILSETVLSYVAVGSLKLAGGNRACAEYASDYQSQIYSLFLGHSGVVGFLGHNDKNDLIEHAPILGSDPFVFITECSTCLASISGINIMHIIRIGYLAELVKAVMAVQEALDNPQISERSLEWLDERTAVPCTQQQAITFQDFWSTIIHMHRRVLEREPAASPAGHEYDEAAQFGTGGEMITRIGFFRALAQKYALTYLRKCAILLHVRYGIDFAVHASSDAEADELTRLTDALKVPTFDQICESLNASSPTPQSVSALHREMVHGWMHHLVIGDLWRGSTTKITVSHPVIFELIGLPKNYDTLMEEVMKSRCPTSGKDVCDPMLCLFCGEIFCGQAICCLKESINPLLPNKPKVRIGGCQQHALK